MRPQRRICLILYLRKMLRNINRILLPDLNTKTEKRAYAIYYKNTCVRPGRSLFGSHGSEYAINNTDYMALENAVFTLQYSFMGTYAQNQIEKNINEILDIACLMVY